MIKRLGSLFCGALAGIFLFTSLPASALRTADAARTIGTDEQIAEAASFPDNNNSLESSQAINSIGLNTPYPSIKSYSDTSLQAMRARAEAITNHEWIPSQNIKTWNGNTYNGLNYFPAGSSVRGVPYTLFTTEVVSWSLLSLEQYTQVESSNYSATAYCVSVSANRTGPVYGSCCADLVCEVFGGSFMNGSSTKYHNVPAVRNSPKSNTLYSQKMSDIRAGDALSDYPDHTHIIWIGEVTDTQITIYEQTPPVARKRILNKSAYTNSNGYFIYGGKQYSVITRSTEFTNSGSEVPIIDGNSPIDIGNDFYARIEHKSTGLFLTNQLSNIAGEAPSGDYNQIWHFIRQSNGSYAIISAYDNSCMDVIGSYTDTGTNVYAYSGGYLGNPNQQFYIYSKDGTFYFSPVHCNGERMLDMSLSTHNLEIWGSAFDWEPQMFNIIQILIIPGDADGNGVVNVIDALTALRMALGLIDNGNSSAVDMDGSGSISVIDALAVLRIALGLA